MKNCMARAFICLKMLQQRPCLSREIETKLSDSRVSYNGVVDYRSLLPIDSLHCAVVSTGVMSDQTGHREASQGGGRSNTSA